MRSNNTRIGSSKPLFKTIQTTKSPWLPSITCVLYKTMAQIFFLSATTPCKRVLRKSRVYGKILAKVRKAKAPAKERTGRSPAKESTNKPLCKSGQKTPAEEGTKKPCEREHGISSCERALGKAYACRMEELTQINSDKKRVGKPCVKVHGKEPEKEHTERNLRKKCREKPLWKSARGKPLRKSARKKPLRTSARKNTWERTHRK